MRIPCQISICIPCYNQEQYIGECLDSILAQTFDDYEIIVVDDGSTDGSAAIVQKYADRCPVLRLIKQKNQGVVSARNNAISAACGQYIYPLDADDKLAPDCLEKLYQVMSSGKVDVVYSLAERFGEETGILPVDFPSVWNMCLGNQVTSAALFRKSDWEKYGGYDPHMNAGWEDWEFWINFVLDGRSFRCIPEKLLFYRITSASRNHRIDKKTGKTLKKYIYNKHSRLLFYRYVINFIRLFFCKKRKKSGETIVKVFGITISKKSSKAKN